MTTPKLSIFKNYQDIILLLGGILVGTIIGVFWPSTVYVLKPIGDIFLNLIFTTVIPLIFFAITSSISNIEAGQKLGKILGVMSTFILVSIVLTAVVTIATLWIFPVSQNFIPSENVNYANGLEDEVSWGTRAAQFLTVDEFNKLLSRQSMLAFVIISFLIGVATLRAGEAGVPFKNFLSSGAEVMKHLLLLIMKVAPLGLGAYFAYQVAEIGNSLFDLYAKPLGLYYILGLFYFIVFFTLFAFIGGGKLGIKRYWKHNIRPTITAVSTCSSIATMPVNLLASKKMGIDQSVANVVIPLGTTLHKHGSAMSSIVKIYVAFVILGWDFFDPMTLLTAIGITVLVSIVAGGIPNGGYIGEMLMISAYGLPVEAIPAVMIIGTLVDPMATILNSTGDTLAAMVTARFSGKPLEKEEPDLSHYENV